MGVRWHHAESGDALTVNPCTFETGSKLENGFARLPLPAHPAMRRSPLWRTTLLASVLTSTFALSGCGGRDKDNEKGNLKVAFGKDEASEPALGPDDVRITSTDGSFVMAVIGDTVRMQLSDSLRNKVKTDIDTSAGKKGGFGAAIAQSVGKVVNGAMGFVVRVPVNDVQNLRYENGKLRFDVRGGGGIKVNNSDNGGNAQFSEADAKRFIEAVERRQQRDSDIAR